MKTSSMSTVEVVHRYLVNHRGELQMFGDCRHMLLTCGHIKHGRPTANWKVGTVVRCFECKP